MIISFVFVGLGVVVGIVGLLFHFFGFQLIVFIHSFSHLLQSFVLRPILQNNCFSLSLHLLGEKPFFFSFQFFLHIFF